MFKTTAAISFFFTPEGCLLNVSFSCFKCCFYLKGRVRKRSGEEKGRGGEEEVRRETRREGEVIFYLLAHLQNSCKNQDRATIKTETQKSHVNAKNASTWTIILLFVRHTSRKLNQKQKTWLNPLHHNICHLIINFKISTR